MSGELSNNNYRNPIKKLTNTQRRFYEVLNDGEPHEWTELKRQLNDPESTKQNVHDHISGLRRYLRPRSFDIMCYDDKGVLKFRLVSGYKGGDSLSDLV